MNLLTHISEWKACEFGKLVTKPKEKLDPKTQKEFQCIELEHIEQEIGLINGYANSKELSSIKNKFQVGDTLFGKLRPYLKKYWLAEFEGGCSSEIWVLRSNPDVMDSKYLFYLVQTHRFIQVTNVTSGSKMPRADWSFVSNFPFAIPTIPEQQKIAEILSTWDQAISTTQKLIDELKLRNKGLAQQLLTGKKRLKGFESKWKKYHYSDILKKVKRPVKWDDKELYNLISVRRRSGGIFYRDALYGHQIKVKNLNTAKTGDFLFSKMQIVHGASALVTPEFDGAKISGSYISVRAKDESILSMEFLNWYSKLPKFYHQTFISSYGVHIEKMTFDFELFLTETIHLPSLKEQQAIVSVLNEADKELQLHQKQIDTLKEQKKGLMQKLLTGEIRVQIGNE